jgi:hypothetical protein
MDAYRPSMQGNRITSMEITTLEKIKSRYLMGRVANLSRLIDLLAVKSLIDNTLSSAELSS